MRILLFALAIAGFAFAIWQKTPLLMPLSVGSMTLALWPHPVRAATIRPVHRPTAGHVRQVVKEKSA